MQTKGRREEHEEEEEEEEEHEEHEEEEEQEGVRDDHSLIGYSACGHTLLVTIPSQIPNTLLDCCTVEPNPAAEID